MKSKNVTNAPNCVILDIWLFNNFLPAVEPFAKVLQILETCELVNNNWCRKLVLSLESLITFNERFKVTWVLFFVVDFNLLICKLDNYKFKKLYSAILRYIKVR